VRAVCAPAHGARIRPTAWHTFDIDARHRRSFGRHELVGGAGLRYWSNRTARATADPTALGNFRMLPAAEQVGTISVFAQDEIELVTDRLRATAGVKFEHSRYSEVGFQPTVRLTWTPHHEHAFWAAGSRAVRTPSRTDRGMSVPAGIAPGPAGLPVLLVDDFNGMLAQIEKQDQQLRNHGERLEEEVQARTRELLDAKEAAEAANRAIS
jgi:outer membrane receptor protein involved in Fe transport